jgi:hypothetical protein
MEVILGEKYYKIGQILNHYRATTRHHIPEDDTLHNHRCENLKSYIIDLLLKAEETQRRSLAE